MSEGPSALDGITVVDLSTGKAGALASMFLADNGARVIRIAFRDEDVVRTPGIFAVYDRGKEILRLDPATTSRELRELCAGADVVLDDFAPGSSLKEPARNRRPQVR